MKKIILAIVLGYLVIMYIVSSSKPKFPDYSYRQCSEAECSKSKVQGSNYCYVHICDERGCLNRAIRNGYCTSHQPKVTSSTNTTKQTNSKTGNISMKSSTVKKNYLEWPDCDDYEDLEDFLDDWDGNMPDGSDAEDYWDNW